MLPVLFSYSDDKGQSGVRAPVSCRVLEPLPEVGQHHGLSGYDLPSVRGANRRRASEPMHALRAAKLTDVGARIFNLGTLSLPFVPLRMLAGERRGRRARVPHLQTASRDASASSDTSSQAGGYRRESMGGDE